MTWSGTFSNETVMSTPYQMKQGVRGVVDMSVLGDVLAALPVPAYPSASASLWFSNPNRNVLTITAPAIQTPDGAVSTFVDVRLKYGVIGFTYFESSAEWHISEWVVFAIPLALTAAALWTPQATNGPCVITDEVGVTSVTRTGVGLYTVEFDMAVPASTFVNFSAYATGMPAENSADVIRDGHTANTVDIVTGLRNKNGQFTDDDLLQDPSNRVSVIAQVLP